MLVPLECNPRVLPLLMSEWISGDVAKSELRDHLPTQIACLSLFPLVCPRCLTHDGDNGNDDDDVADDDDDDDDDALMVLMMPLFCSCQ